MNDSMISSLVVAGMDDVCITCSGWLDEGTNDYRDVLKDSGSGLSFEPSQYHLTNTSDVDETFDKFTFNKKGN